MNSGAKEYLKNVKIFEGLAEEYIENLSRIARPYKFKKGEAIFSEGEVGDGFYVLINGRVKIFKLSPDGKEQTLHIFGPGEPFGEVPVFAGEKFPANAEALEDSHTYFFSRKDFFYLIKKNPAIAMNMLAILSKRLRRFAYLIEGLSLKEVPARLAAYLLYLSERYRGERSFKLDITKSQLASLLGTIPETLSRVLAKLVNEGIIQYQGSIIEIKDIDALVELESGERRLR